MRPIHLHALNLALAGGLLVLTGCGDQSSSGTERPSDAANLPTLLMPPRNLTSRSASMHLLGES